jgi:hypothetical protein
MLKYCLAVVFVGLALVLNGYSATAQERDGIIATIVEVEGGATIMADNGKPVKVVKDQPVYMNDVIQVDKGGRALVLFIDNTQWTLSSGAIFRADEYAFDPADNTDNHANYSVMGAFQYVSGLVAKKPEPEVTIKTPVGSIGIRGTDITAAPDDTGGYDIYVDEGMIDMTTDAGAARMKQGEGGFIKDRKSKPAAQRMDRLQKLRGDVALKNRGDVMARIAQMKDRQQALRAKFQEFMKNNPEMRQKLQQRREMRKQQMQQKMQLQIQERKEQRQQQLQQQNQEKAGQMRQQMQQRQQERQEKMRDELEEKRKLRQERWRKAD